MSIAVSQPNINIHSTQTPNLRRNLKKNVIPCVNYSLRPQFINGASFCNFKLSSSSSSRAINIRARSMYTSFVETSDSTDVFFCKTFPLKQIQKVEGKILIRLDSGENKENWLLTVGCTLPGKWILHWGVNYVNDVGSEWDQPPLEMRPTGSVPIKDNAIETALEDSSTASELDTVKEVKIDFNTSSSIASINFVLKDEETGAWYQHRGRDFKVPLIGYRSNEYLYDIYTHTKMYTSYL